jgi:hypothetical protein
MGIRIAFEEAPKSAIQKGKAKQINLFGVSKEKGFIYLRLPVDALKSKDFEAFLYKHFPDYLRFKKYEKIEKDCPFCNPLVGKKKASRHKHGHDELEESIEKGGRIILIKGRHELHLIFLGHKADVVSSDFDNWFKFVK